MNSICAQIPAYMAESFGDKLKLLQSLKLHCLELSSQETRLEQLPISEVLRMRGLLYDEGCSVTLYQIPVRHMDEDAVRTLMRYAHLLEIDYFLCDPEGCGEEEIRFFFKAAASFGIRLMVENKAGTALGTAGDIEAFFKRHADAGCSLAFNPLEFLRLKQHPFFHVYYKSRLKNQISLLRICDGLYTDGRPVPLGQGNGEVKELISIMKARSFPGAFSLTPYLPNISERDLRGMVHWLRETLKEI